MIDHKTTYEADIIERLVSQYKDSDAIVELLEVMAGDEGLQELEDVIHERLRQLLPEYAVGAQLNVIGRADECYRQGTADDEYRQAIKAHYMALSSGGTAPEILRIMDAWVVWLVNAGFVRYTQTGRAAYRLEYECAPGLNLTDAQTTRLDLLLSLATAAGVEYCAVEGSDGVFRLDTGPGLDVGLLARRVV
jgi:hypothetical protein